VKAAESKNRVKYSWRELGELKDHAAPEIGLVVESHQAKECVLSKVSEISAVDGGAATT
jgi:hypothetical protein